MTSLGRCINNFLISPIIVQHLFILLCTCSLKFMRLSRNMPKCFTEVNEATLFLLKVKSSDFSLSAVLEKYSSWACLFLSGLNCIFHWKAQLFINSKSLFKVARDTCLSKPSKKGRYLQQNFTVAFKAIWQVIYVYQKE